MSLGLCANGRRGEPLVALVLIIGGWFALRILIWQSPFEIHPPTELAASRPSSEASRRPPPNAVQGRRGSPTLPAPADASWIEPPPAPWHGANAPNLSAATRAPGESSSALKVVGQQMPLLAAFAHMDVPAEIARHFAPPQAGATTTLASVAPRAAISSNALDTRWTGDGWLLLRSGSAGPVGAGAPSYGRSQAGAVLRYRLAPSNGHRPIAYVRATRALSGPRENEVAAGFAARPLIGVPLRLAGEMRVSDGSAGREIRPAALVVTELAPANLRRGLRAEAYVQAGYVGGRYATPFVDGQARLDARAAPLGRDGELRAGGGVWGGAQKGVQRLDIGPSAVASFRFGGTPARVAFDYRVRVAGDAAPKSGPALTISAGF